MYGMTFIFRRWAVLVTRVSSSALLGLKSRWSQESSFSTLAMLPLVPCQIQLCSVSTEPSFRHSLSCSSEGYGFFHEKECNMPSRDCAQSKARGGKTETHNWPDPLNRNGIDHGAFQLPGAWAATEPTGERPIPPVSSGRKKLFVTFAF